MDDKKSNIINKKYKQQRKICNTDRRMYMLFLRLIKLRYNLYAIQKSTMYVREGIVRIFITIIFMAVLVVNTMYNIKHCSRP